MFTLTCGWYPFPLRLLPESLCCIKIICFLSIAYAVLRWQVVEREYGTLVRHERYRSEVSGILRSAQAKVLGKSDRPSVSQETQRQALCDEVKRRYLVCILDVSKTFSIPLLATIYYCKVNRGTAVLINIQLSRSQSSIDRLLARAKGSEGSFESGTSSKYHFQWLSISSSSFGYCRRQLGFAAYFPRFATLSLSPLVLAHIIRNFLNFFTSHTTYQPPGQPVQRISHAPKNTFDWSLPKCLHHLHQSQTSQLRS